jgi:epsilon-lactone hydrolase
MASQELQLAVQLCRLSRRNRGPTVVQLGRLAQLRADYDEIANRHLLPSGVRYQPLDAGGVSAEWMSGPDAGDNRAILYLHGGCYATGSVATHRDLMTRLAIASSMRVLA